jgi:hypothetical protein
MVDSSPKCFAVLWLTRYSVGFEVLTGVAMKSPTFWGITPCSRLKVNWRFGGTYRRHLQRRRISRARNQHEGKWQAEPHTNFLLGLFLDPDYGRDMFLRNVDWLSSDYTALYPKREYFSTKFSSLIHCFLHKLVYQYPIFTRIPTTKKDVKIFRFFTFGSRNYSLMGCYHRFGGICFLHIVFYPK